MILTSYSEIDEEEEMEVLMPFRAFDDSDFYTARACLEPGRCLNALPGIR